VAFVDFPKEEWDRLSSPLRGHCLPIPMKSENLAAGTIPAQDVPVVVIRSTKDQQAALPWLREVRRFFPEQELCFVTPQVGVFPLAAALDTRVWCNLILEQALANRCAQLKRVVRFLSEPLDRRLMSRALPEPSWRRDTLVSKSDKQRLAQRISEEFALFTDDAGQRYQLELCVEEVLNNSIFHAFRNPDGTEKYQVARFTMLAPSDRLDIAFGYDEDFFCLAVSDNAGSLELDTLFSKLRYDEEESNLFLERGRGLFLMRCYSHENYISVARGRMTTVMMLFHRDPPKSAKRPLLVRWIDASASPDGVAEGSLWSNRAS
jgi:anti-sigma regulatory factor (Ser/Thr protein kinase)